MTIFVLPKTGIINDPEPCTGRLTLTSGTPVTVGDVAGATTIYFTPFRGNILSLYNGTTWKTRFFTELSIAVPATTNTMYDVFIYDNAGTLTLEVLVWTNDTTRATAIVFQDGVYVKSGATTRRYLGSFRTTGVSGQVNDTTVVRYLWNYYNRIGRTIKNTFVSTHTYTTGAWRAWNNNTTIGQSRVVFIVGVVEDDLELDGTWQIRSSATSQKGFMGIGINILNGSNASQVHLTNAVITFYGGISKFKGAPSLGWSFANAVEFGGSPSITFITTQMFGNVIG